MATNSRTVMQVASLQLHDLMVMGLSKDNDTVFGGTNDLKKIKSAIQLNKRRIIFFDILLQSMCRVYQKKLD
jgi:hypothetical protein